MPFVAETGYDAGGPDTSAEQAWLSGTVVSQVARHFSGGDLAVRNGGFAEVSGLRRNRSENAGQDRHGVADERAVPRGPSDASAP